MNLIDVIEKNKCTGCMSCKNVCPVNAIKIERNADGFQYPKIDQTKCIHCNLCKKACPVVTTLKQQNNETKAYACKNKNTNVRMQSSSGGIFTLIAEDILNQNGVIFGAKFNQKFEVVHDYVLKKEELSIFRGSKYLQSKIGDSYKKVKKFLEEGKKVLFTGTPCQVEGLLSYLGKDYENLYTQDIICHGVPSPKVWKKYLEYKKQNKKIKEINFRKKDILGWNNYQVNYKYENSEENIHHEEDIYMKLFLQNLILRQSCYSCNFKKINRKSDITLADFWGIDKVLPEFNDEKGTSALIVHSKKGKEIFDRIKEHINFIEVNVEDIKKYNPCLCKSAHYNDNRNQFFKVFNKEGLKTAIEEFL